MHLILAENIDGGIFALLIFGGGLLTSVLALMALVPAAQGNKPLTLLMIAPAFIAGLAVTGWFAYGSFTDYPHDPDFDFAHDFLMPWLFLAGAPFGASALGVCVLWWNSRKLN